jgi:hypothetical protein
VGGAEELTILCEGNKKESDGGTYVLL